MFALQDDAQLFWPLPGQMLSFKITEARLFTTRGEAEKCRRNIHARNGGKGPWQVVEV